MTKKDVVRTIEDTKIGVINLETYENSSTNQSLVYAAGLYFYIDNNPILFILTKKLLIVAKQC